MLGRVLVDGDADVPAVRALQAQYRLTPLSMWGKRGVVVPGRRDVYAPVKAGEDPLGPWKTLNAMLAENPPPEHHAVVLGQFARIGIGPGLDVEAQPDVVKQGLTRAAMTGMALLRQQFLSGDWATVVNGWRYPPPDMGHFGDDFLQRAADQSMAGITANDPAESVYLVNFTDADGSPLAPGGRYELHFTAGSLPPVDAFWSLAAYTTKDMNLIPNAADRYSVGDRTPGLRWDQDGGLTIRLQPEPPGRDGKPNWLPTSATAPVVRDLADVPAPPRGHRRHLEMPGHHHGGVTSQTGDPAIQFTRTESCALPHSAPVSRQKRSTGHEAICQAATR